MCVCACKASNGCGGTKKLGGKKNRKNKKKKNATFARRVSDFRPIHLRIPVVWGGVYARQSIHTGAGGGRARYKPRSRSKLTFAEKLCRVVFGTAVVNTFRTDVGGPPRQIRDRFHRILAATYGAGFQRRTTGENRFRERGSNTPAGQGGHSGKRRRTPPEFHSKNEKLFSPNYVYTTLGLYRPCRGFRTNGDPAAIFVLSVKTSNVGFKRKMSTTFFGTILSVKLTFYSIASVYSRFATCNVERSFSINPE